MMKVVSIAIVVIIAIANSFSLARADERPPNIVLILSDDQAWTDYGFMGHDAIQTPNLDELAKSSSVFRRGYVPTALCRPSLMTLLTGHYASTHGITGNDPSPKYAKPNSELYNQRRAQLISYLDRFDSIPKLLAKQGYVSHQSGKLWEGSFQQAGFTDGMTRGFPEPGGRHGDDGLAIGREGIQPIADFVGKAVKDEKPFYLWYAPFMPHSPHTPPKRILDKYAVGDRPISVARYYAMCEWFDETCGQVLKLIDDQGQRDNTLVVYVTDNGWIQDPDSDSFAPRSKQTPYEGGVRTPIMYRWPGKIQVNDRPELATSLDIVPTMLAAAGAVMPNDLPGLNLLPNLESGQKIDRERIFGETFAHDIADIEKPRASLLFRWVIEGRYKLLLTYDGEANRSASANPRTNKDPQLFDLIDDPTELHNLAPENSGIVTKLSAALDDWYPVNRLEEMPARLR